MSDPIRPPSPLDDAPTNREDGNIVLRHSRREGLGIALVWLLCMIYCCAFAHANGYIRPDRPLGVEDVRPIWGVPFWVFWGVLVPWAVVSAFGIYYAIAVIRDDDLGADLTDVVGAVEPDAPESAIGDRFTKPSTSAPRNPTGGPDHE